MSSWNSLSVIYRRCRRLPGIRMILDSEIRNCRALWSRIQRIPDRILDVGTGAGSSLELFPNEIPVIAVDASRKMLSRARIRRPGLIAIQADACALPLRDDSFSVTSAIGLTEYLPNLDDFFKETGRVTRPGGFFLSTLARRNMLNRLRILLGNRLYFIKADQWENEAAAAGWEIEGRAASLLQIQQLLRKSRS